MVVMMSEVCISEENNLKKHLNMMFFHDLFYSRLHTCEFS